MSVLFHSDFSVGGEPTRGDIERLVVSRGTDGSNPVPSSEESAANSVRTRELSPAPTPSAARDWFDRLLIERKTPRRMRCRVIFEKKFSTALSQEAEVG